VSLPLLFFLSFPLGICFSKQKSHTRKVKASVGFVLNLKQHHNLRCPTLATPLFLWLGWDTTNPAPKRTQAS
jgi:hypothetical protein